MRIHQLFLNQAAISALITLSDMLTFASNLCLEFSYLPSAFGPTLIYTYSTGFRHYYT